MARQQPPKQIEWPLFERFRQQGVIGVAEGALRDVPGQRPFHGEIIHQQAHQFGDGDRRMGVIQLDREFFVEALGRNFLHADDAQHVLQRAGHEEVLLFEPQLLALHLLVVRVQHLGQILASHFLIDRAVMVAAIEDREIEGFRRLGAPQAQRVRGVGAVAEDGRVVGHAVDDAIRDPARTQATAFVGVGLGVAAELDLDHPFRPHQLPGIAVAQPFVGFLRLPAVDDLLLKNAEFITNAIVHRRHLQGRQ